MERKTHEILQRAAARLADGMREPGAAPKLLELLTEVWELGHAEGLMEATDVEALAVRALFEDILRGRGEKVAVN